LKAARIATSVLPTDVAADQAIHRQSRSMSRACRAPLLLVGVIAREASSNPSARLSGAKRAPCRRRARTLEEILHLLHRLADAFLVRSHPTPPRRSSRAFCPATPE